MNCLGVNLFMQNPIFGTSVVKKNKAVTYLVAVVVLIPVVYVVAMYLFVFVVDVLHGEDVQFDGVSFRLENGMFVSRPGGAGRAIVVGKRESVFKPFASDNFLSVKVETRERFKSFLKGVLGSCGGDCSIISSGEYINESGELFDFIQYKSYVKLLKADFHAFYFFKQRNIIFQYHGKFSSFDDYMKVIDSVEDTEQSQERRGRMGST